MSSDDQWGLQGRMSQPLGGHGRLTGGQWRVNPRMEYDFDKYFHMGKGPVKKMVILLDTIIFCLYKSLHHLLDHFLKPYLFTCLLTTLGGEFPVQPVP